MFPSPSTDQLKFLLIFHLAFLRVRQVTVHRSLGVKRNWLDD